MKQLLIIFFLTFMSITTFASDFSAVITFEKTKSGLLMKGQTVESGIPFKTSVEDVKTKLATVTNKKEALVFGRIDYERNQDGGLRPVFIIERMTFVTLKELGTIHDSIPEPVFSLDRQQAFVPYSFPVTTEVASALTLTSSLLLMNSLTAGDNKDVRNDIRTGLFISAGTMATLLFLYEQLSGKTKP